MFNLEDFIGGCLVSFAAFFLAVATLGIPFVHFTSLGSGNHTGYITAVDQRGILFQNYQVYFKTDNSSSQEDIYCVHRDNQDLVNTLKDASTQGKKVTISYEGVRAIGLGLCDGAEIKEVN